MEIIEKWKQIPNSTYAISNIGRLKRSAHVKLHNINKTYYLSKEKILKPSNNNSKKYWRKPIYYSNGTIINESIHRLVAQSFVPNPLNLLQVNHIDGNKDNNYYTNLEWVTNKENMEHRYLVLKKFNNLKGSSCIFSKLTEANVIDIVNRIKEGNKLITISKYYGVAPTTISEIKAGRSWSHLGLFPYKKRKSEKYDKQKLGLRYSPTTTEK